MRFILVLLIALLLSACGGHDMVQDSAPSSHHVDLESIPDAVPQHEPKSRYGNPEQYTVLGNTYQTMASSAGFVQRGKASWYGTKFHGRNTSNGERYNMYAMTAAHKALPIPTYVRVTNLRNGKSVTVRVNDRGPFHEDRIIDLSYAAAARLDMLKTGTTEVEIRAIDASQPRIESTTESTPSLQAESLPDAVASSQLESIPPASSPQMSTTPKQLYVQVGAYSQVNNAIQVKQRLQVAGLSPVRVHTEQITNSTLYKVQLGPVQDLDAADRIRRSLDELGLSKVSYVSY